MLAAGISPRSMTSSLLKDAKHDKHAAARAKSQAEQAAVQAKQARIQLERDQLAQWSQYKLDVVLAGMSDWVVH